jgi:hypothetical protein
MSEKSGLQFRTPVHVRCGCREFCGDIPEDQDDPMAICKDLRRAPEPPPVEIVLVHRDTGEVIR